MNVWKLYKVQFLLLLLAGFQIFNYFYPGYAKGILFALFQAGLIISIIVALLLNRNEVIKNHYQ